ncbi:MAG: phytanoyl-CoA dioxygenase family protein [Rhodospirillaceae bacterium]|nr:phytanoyl-CoA dioxygenase family protein [Rhodospirillaceae bacterium]
MPKLLPPGATAAYARDGFWFPVRVMPAGEAAQYRAKLEAYEGAAGGPIAGNMRHKVHLLFTWADALVRHPRILDAVEDLLGPDLLCWTTNFFIKEPRDPGFVSWHQDSTYWGLEPHDVVTAWLALSEAPVESGAMKFLPGSHTQDQLPHTDTYHEHNLLTRGQEVAVAVDEKLAIDVPLRAGEMSLHHIKLVHGSKPNITGDRRIGLAIRYIPTSVRQTKVADSATLVRGTDRFGHFELETPPQADCDAQARAAHRRVMERQIATYYSGTGIKEARR